ncbi:MAG: trypsin-like serine peptidase [Nostoc sp. EfeVER01]|uniref:trypsin-like serine peptidase n=1 Tax=unclassified Nostoc TaxID=2593658 RepID=UPI002AD31DAE|nr:MULTISPECIES: trypsin-like serine protease [unclassified Nostoc]MDZ7948848.1 trypsin-like serine protease [Nostoc sp. EfeVER01]MDZ7991324.1 trypsin-like serine protease [Nostoc sp. EspVER01]
MTKKPIYKQFFALFFAGIISAITLGGWVSVHAQAQTETQESKPPTFSKFQEASEFKLPANGNPFKPSDLNQSKKADEVNRGIPTGKDYRIPMTSRKYPWSTIGRVQGTTTDAKNYHCTGTLIDDDIVLTNAHCVIDPDTHKLSQKILFMPNMINGVAEDKVLVEQVVYGTDFTDDKLTNQINDWALLKINQPLGRKYGHLGWKSLRSSTLINNPKTLFFVGYSGDFPNPKKKGYEDLTAGRGWTASFEAGCSIVGEESGVLLHDCATAGGSSGGPLIAYVGEQPYIIALNNAEIKNLETNQDITNLAVKIDFLDKLAAGN